jgi:hypothetical protein
VGEVNKASSRSAVRLQAALQFLSGYSNAMRDGATSAAQRDSFAAAFWWAREPSYAWETAYGDFAPATLNAGIKRGLIEKDGYRPAYRITDLGRQALKDAPK